MKRLGLLALLGLLYSASAFAGGSSPPGIMQSGTVTAGHCAQFSASGVAIDAGASCGTGTAGVTQAQGTSGQTLVNGDALAHTGAITVSLPSTITPSLTFSGLNAYGTPASITLTNATGLPVSTGISGFGTGISTWLATPSSANLLSALTTKTGTGSVVFATSPTISAPTITGVPVLSGLSAGTQVSCLGLDSLNNVVLNAAACGSGGGGSLAVTDGTHSVSGTTQITFSGATVSGTTPNATVTVSGGGAGVATITDGTHTQTSTTTLSLGNGIVTTNGSSGTAPLNLAFFATETTTSCSVGTTSAGCSTSSGGDMNNGVLASGTPTITLSAKAAGLWQPLQSFWVYVDPASSGNVTITNSTTLTLRGYTGTTLTPGTLVQYIADNDGTHLDALATPAGGTQTLSNTSGTTSAVLATSTHVLLTGTLTGALTVPLPAVATVPANTVLIIDDASGSATTTNTQTVTANGTETINGTASGTFANTVPNGRIVLTAISGGWNAAGSIPNGASGALFLGQGTTNAPAWQPVSGDATLSNTGALTVNTTTGRPIMTADAGAQNNSGTGIQNKIFGGSGNYFVGQQGDAGISNDGTTGTTSSKLVGITTAGNAILFPHTQTMGVVGVCNTNPANNCGTGATKPTLISAGDVTLTLDGAAVAGDWIVPSTTTDGDGHDSGVAVTSTPPLGALGVSLGTGTTPTVHLMLPQSGRPPAGSTGNVQYNNSGAVGGIANGTSTQVLHGGSSPAMGAVNLGTDVTGTLPNAGLANSSVPVDGITCTLGTACAPAFGFPTYQANSWYPPYAGGAVLGSNAYVVTSTYCSPGYLPALTIKALGAGISTLGTSNIQLAVYANGSNNRPNGSALANTANIVDTSTGAVSGTITNTSLTGGMYWFCAQVNDTTAKLLSYQASSASPTSITISQMIGSATLGNVVGSPNNTVAGVLTTGTTFGTWPTFTTGTTWTEETGSNSHAPYVVFEVNSQP